MDTKTLKLGLKIGLLSFIFLGFSACETGNYKSDVSVESVDITDNYKAVEEATAYDVTEKPAVKDSKIKTEYPKELKIIKSANARYKVKSVQLSTEEIKLLASSMSAYISDLRFQNNLYSKENRFTIKVPQESFDTLLDSIHNVVDFVEYENITTQDVTEEYMDLNTRLKTKLEVKKRYEEILRKNAKTVKDILATEDKLRQLQEEIESAQGRLKYLTNRVAYSTIQIDLYEEVEYTEKPVRYTKTFVDKATDGLKFGWELIQGFILAVLHIWPLVLIVTGLVIWIRKRGVKK